jgi:hypothetical protein
VAPFRNLHPSTLAHVGVLSILYESKTRMYFGSMLYLLIFFFPPNGESRLLQIVNESINAHVPRYFLRDKLQNRRQASKIILSDSKF